MKTELLNMTNIWLHKYMNAFEIKRKKATPTIHNVTLSHTHSHLSLHTHTCMHTHTHAHANKQKCICITAHKHTHTHTNTCTDTQTHEKAETKTSTASSSCCSSSAAVSSWALARLSTAMAKNTFSSVSEARVKDHTPSLQHTFNHSRVEQIPQSHA